MIEWFRNLDPAGIVFACIAFPSTLVLVVQIVMMLIGLGGDDTDVDLPDDGFDMGDDLSEVTEAFNADVHFRFLTARGIVAFLVTFGWMGLTLHNIADMKAWAASLIALAAGLAMMALVAWLLHLLFRLQSDGTMNIRNAIGATATVYLTIPPTRTATGKVSVIIQGASREVDAVTDSETPLVTGTEVTVVGVRGGDTLVVIPH